MRARDVALAGWVAAALVLTGCSGDEDRPGAVATRTVTATPTATSTPPVVLRLTAEGARYFETPSRNITCFLIASGTGRRVECTVRSREFEDPPKPDDCDVAWIPQFTLDTEASYGACRGDVNNPLPPVVLEYGTVALNGPIRCTSRESGLTCRNAETDHGFTVNRRSYELF